MERTPYVVAGVGILFVCWFYAGAPLWVLWACLTIAIPTAVLATGFMYVMHAKRILQRPPEEIYIDGRKVVLKIPFELIALGYFWLIIGYPADVAFNLIRGTIMFRELPREWLFSDRVQRHVLESSGRDLVLALTWAVVLNEIDEGHIQIPGVYSDA